MFESRIIQVLLEVAAVRVQLQSPWTRVLLRRKVATSRLRRTEVLLGDVRARWTRRITSWCPRTFRQIIQPAVQVHTDHPARWISMQYSGTYQKVDGNPIYTGNQSFTATVSDLSNLLTSSRGICDVIFEICVQSRVMVFFTWTTIEPFDSRDNKCKKTL